jgi:hypothetical protein
MALTRAFKQTVRARVQRDGKYREALFTGAINACLTGDTASGKAMLRDLVNATIGYEGLAAAIRKPSKSLHRMLSPHGKPWAVCPLPITNCRPTTCAKRHNS